MYQLTLDGSAAPAGNSVKERIRSILRQHPDARNDYQALKFHYWVEVDGLAQILDAETLEEFRRWFVGRATSGKTLQNRAMELQREHPGLDACDDVREWRNRQAVAGPVGE